MRRKPALVLGFVLLGVAAPSAAAQDTRREVRPEFDLYVQHGERTRFVFENRLSDDPGTYTQGAFIASIEIALRPLFRRQLARQPNVFRNRYLVFRVGVPI